MVAHPILLFSITNKASLYSIDIFTNKEFKLLDRVAKRIGDNFSVLLSGNYEYAMNLINCKYSDMS